MATADEIAGRTERRDRGAEILNAVHPQTTKALVDALADIAPDLGSYVFEFAFGDIYSRPELDLQERQMITLASLTSLGGCEAQLRTHVAGAIKLGIEPRKVVETILHCVPYVGFPRVLNAITVTKEVFDGLGLLPIAKSDS